MNVDRVSTGDVANPCLTLCCMRRLLLSNDQGKFYTPDSGEHIVVERFPESYDWDWFGARRSTITSKRSVHSS